MSHMSWEEAVQWLRSQPDKQELVRACYFDDPLLAAARRFHDSEEWHAVCEFMPSLRGKALDVGAGRGIASFALATDGWDVTALEPDSSSIVGAGAIASLAEEVGFDIHIVCEEGEKLPFPDASFDLVYARQVLHHARDLGQLCSELARVLKPGGTFIAVREHVIDLPEELETFSNSHPLHRLYGGENAFALEHYLDAICRAGLLVRQVLLPSASPVNYFPAGRQDMLRRAADKWPWDVTMQDEDRIAQLDRLATCPGRLYSFVALKPATGEADAVAGLASRMVVLEARLHAREIALRKIVGDGHASLPARLEKLERNVFIRVAQKCHCFLARMRHMQLH